MDEVALALPENVPEVFLPRIAWRMGSTVAAPYHPSIMNIQDPVDIPDAIFYFVEDGFPNCGRNSMNDRHRN